MKILTIILSILFAITISYAQDEAQKGEATEEPAQEETHAAPQNEKTTTNEQVKKENAAPQQNTAVKEQPAVVVFDEARQLAMLDANPKNADVYNRLLKFYTNEGRRKDRLKIALKAIQNIGGNVNLYLIVGDENKYLGDSSKALISYQFALKIQPNDPNIYNRIGLALLKLQNYNQAETAFKAALFYSPDDGPFVRSFYYNNLAVAYEAMHDLKSAYKNFQLALKDNPANTVMSDNFIRVRDSLKKAGEQF